MPTLARLTLWFDPAAQDLVCEVFEGRLDPILAGLGLTEGSPCPRPGRPGMLSRLFSLPDPGSARAAARALRRDADWQVEMVLLGSNCGLRPSGAAVLTEAAPLSWELGLYSTPAGPGHPIAAGPGTRRGLWHAYGLPDGLPSPVVNRLLQDSAGRLWMTTGDGICCFDGSRFLHWGAADGLPHATTLPLAEDSEGCLWFAGEGAFVFARHGVCRYDGETFEYFTRADGLPSDAAYALTETPADALWVFTDRGPARFLGDRFEAPPVLEGRLPSLIYRAMVDADGGVWLATREGVCSFSEGRYEWVPDELGAPAGPIWSCLIDRSGHFWAGGPHGLYVRQGDAPFRAVPVDDLLGTAGAGPMLEDREGGLWLSAFPAGLLHLSDRGRRAFTVPDGLPGPRVSDGLVDRDGQIWVAFNGGGLARYDGDRIAHVTTRDGLLHDGCTFIRRDRSGRLWVGTDRGVSRWDGTQWEAVLPTDHWSPALIDLLEEPDGTRWGVTHRGQVQRCRREDWEAVLEAAPDSFNNGALARDWEGGIWCANGAEGVHRYHQEAWTTFTPEEHGAPAGQSRALAIDPQRRRVWVGTTSGMVGYWDGSGFAVALEGEAWDGRCVLHLFVDQQSRLWIGTEGAGVACWEEAVLRIYTSADGLAGDRVLRIGQDRQGHLVFCTQGGGVSLFDDEVLQRLTRRDGLSSDVVKDFLQDEDGAYWFASELGLTRYRPSARGPSVRLSEVMADRTYHPPLPRGMGPSDYRAEPRPDPTGSSSPRRRARARPAGAEGVAPEATGPSGQLPDPLAIPTSQACLRIAFEGSSLTSRPDALAYRYRLVGLEPDWSVTREREVTYSHLPRGTYAFEVQAVDPDLRRSEAATLALEAIPDPRDEALAEAFRQSAPSGDLVGRSPATARLQQQLHEVADSDATVLLMGETGTGKGLAARCLHELSARRDGPFVQVNCGAIALSLIESELFGHERGAFTDAHTCKLGKVELAAGGTLFLDEIGEMHTDAQVRLLRLLEERTYERVGGTQTHSADVRVVAATNRDLPQLVQAGGFREDLYFRLSVFPITLPALRDRGKDIDLLAVHFLATVSRPRGQPPPEITPAALAALRRHAWPGNIRELRNVLERATLVCRGQPIEPEHLALGLQGGREQAGAAGSGAWPSLDEHERAYLLEVLEATAWRVSGPRGAAHLLGMPESTLRSRLASLGIRRPGKT